MSGLGEGKGELERAAHAFLDVCDRAKESSKGMRTLSSTSIKYSNFIFC